MPPAPGRRMLSVVAVAVLALAAGCGDSAPVEVPVAEACAKDNRGDRVIVDGYLRLPASLTISDTAVVDLFTERGGAGDRVSVEVPIGDGPGQLRDLPERYFSTSLRVGLEDGQEATIIDRVRVTARVDDVDGACVLTGPEIVAAPTN